MPCTSYGLPAVSSYWIRLLWSVMIANVEKKGQPITSLDSLITATAYTQYLTLMTHNARFRPWDLFVPLILQRDQAQESAGCGKPHVRWCGRDNGRNPVIPYPPQVILAVAPSAPTSYPPNHPTPNKFGYRIATHHHADLYAHSCLVQWLGLRRYPLHPLLSHRC